MLGIGEADEFKVEFRSLFVFAGAVNVARSEVVLVGIAVFVGAADMSVAQDEIGLGLSRYPSRVGLRREQGDPVVAAPLKGWLFDGLELPDVEVRAGNGVLSHAEFRLQSQSGSVGSDVWLVDGSVVAQTPWDDLLAHDAEKSFLKDGEFAGLSLALEHDRADVPFLECVHVQDVLGGRRWSADDQGDNMSHSFARVLHGSEEQAASLFVATFRLAQQLGRAFLASLQEAGEPYLGILRVEAHVGVRRVELAVRRDPSPRNRNANQQRPGFLLL